MSMSSPLKCYICPSILSADFSTLAQECNKILDLGADWLHVDVMDGHFVDNLTIGPPVVKSLRKHTKGFIDCHLMVSEPQKWAKDFCTFGADNFTFHIECVKNLNDDKVDKKYWDLSETIQLVKTITQYGKKCSVSIKPGTPVERLYPLLDSKECEIFMVLVMTVEPGFGGQSFMADMMPKVAELRKRYPTLNIQVDGGLAEDTIEAAASAGANVIVAGSAIFGSKDPKATMANLRQVVEKHIANSK